MHFDLILVRAFSILQSQTEESVEYLKYEVSEMKGRLDSGVDKIDKTSNSATSRVEKMENMVSNAELFILVSKISV